MLTLEQTIAIASLLNTRLEAAVGILAGAFGDSPLARYCFADQSENYERAIRAYARLACDRRAVAGGTHLVAFHDEQPVGVAGVLPPEYDPFPASLHARWSWFAALVGPHATRRIARIERAIERHRPAAPHCTIGALGVLPDARGRGTGRALLDAASAYAELHPDASGIYAVAASPEAVAFYERAGYLMVDQEALDGLTFSCLFRPCGA